MGLKLGPDVARLERELQRIKPVLNLRIIAARKRFGFIEAYGGSPKEILYTSVLDGVVSKKGKEEDIQLRI